MATTTTSGSKARTTGKATQRAADPKKKAPSGSRAPAGRAPSRSRASGKKAQAGAEGMHVHTAHPTIPIPYVTREDISANMRAAGSALPGVKLPPPERLAFYGGLGALAVAGAVEWPVAAAIGVATMVARRSRREKE
jgi:hypothetical protein